MTVDVANKTEMIEALGIASALIKARSELGMTQSQLAEESGLSRSAIKGYETGRNMPGARELRSLCKVLRISPNYLLFGVENPFAEEARADVSPNLRLMLLENVDSKVARIRLAALSDLLARDEVDSLLNLVQALALARHGKEVLEQAILGADVMAALSESMGEVAQRSVTKQDPLTTGEITGRMEKFLESRGHKPKE